MAFLVSFISSFRALSRFLMSIDIVKEHFALCLTIGHDKYSLQLVVKLNYELFLLEWK